MVLKVTRMGGADWLARVCAAVGCDVRIESMFPMGRV